MRGEALASLSRFAAEMAFMTSGRSLLDAVKLKSMLVPWGSALADHIHHDASVGEDLQITCHRVALELGILHTDHHQARLNIDFGYTVHSKHSILPIGRSDTSFMQAPKIRC